MLSFPFIASQRGLSGIKQVSNKKIAAGNAAPQNIQRHPICPFHEAQISAEVKSAGIGSAISQLVICAPRIPSTMVNWFNETSLPRTEVGATSAIYIGDNPEAIPIPIPPKKRATKNQLNVEKAPVAYAEEKKINAEINKSGLRP